MINFSKKCCIDGKIQATGTSILDNVGHDETKTNKTVTATIGDRTRVVRIRYVIKTTLALNRSATGLSAKWLCRICIYVLMLTYEL